MRKKGQVGMILTITIGLILGIVMFQIIFTTIDSQVTTTAITKDPFTASNGTCVQVTDNCIALGTGVLVNGTNDVTVTANFSECQVNNPDKLNGFVLSPDLGGNEFDGVQVNASYSDRSCSFIGGATTQIVLNLLPLLFAVVLLVFVAGFIVLKR